RAPADTPGHLAERARGEPQRGPPQPPAPDKPPRPAARHTPPPPAPAKSPAARPAPKPAVSSAPSELTKVFANVALVNKVVGVAGGVDQARKGAEAVRAGGGGGAVLKAPDPGAGGWTAQAGPPV